MCHLKKHIAMVHEIHDKTVPCQRCPKFLKNKESLKNHISGVHEGKYKSICHLCDKELATPIYLKIHINTIHEGHKKFVCPTCGQPFAQSQSLKKHVLLIHEKRKDHICETCGRAFSLKGDLKKHIMAIHHGIKYAGVAKLRKEETYKQIESLLNNSDLDRSKAARPEPPGSRPEFIENPTGPDPANHFIVDPKLGPPEEPNLPRSDFIEDQVPGS